MVGMEGDGAMFKQALDKRHARGKPIQVAFVGAGRMGTGAICQIGLMRGISVAVIADLSTERATRAFELSGYRREDVVVANAVGPAQDAIRQNKPVVTQDATLVPQLEIDAVVDATGSPELGARVALQTIQARKHIIMLNVETDVVVGPILHRMAQAAGVVYTVSSGDEPGLIAEFYDRYAGLGFEIVAVGKAPSSIGLFDRFATPDSVGEDAKRLGVNPHFLVTFRDATKTMIEMACISNYTGLVPDIRGMHGPIAGVNEIPQLFRPKSEGGILNTRGVVDYARPLKHEDGSIDFDRSVTPGTFIVVHTDHKQIQEDLQLSRCHRLGRLLQHVHALSSGDERDPALDRQCGGLRPSDHRAQARAGDGGFRCRQTALTAGETVEGAGGSSVYALNDLYETAKADNVVPLGLLTDAKLLRDVRPKRPSPTTWSNVQTDTTLYHLRALQNSMEPATSWRRPA